MRYPTITRIFAVLLLICSLAMLTVGAWGMGQAEKYIDGEYEKLSGLKLAAEDYKSLTLALEGRISYEEADRQLQSRIDSHSEAASEHRRKLAEYTAMKGGLSAGSEALDGARAAMEENKAYYEEGVRQLNEISAYLNEMKIWADRAGQMYEAGQELFNMALEALGMGRQLLNEFYYLDDIMDSGDEQGRLEISLGACDRAIAAYENLLLYSRELRDKGLVTDEQLQSAEAALISMTGMSSTQLLAQLYNTRQDIAAGAEGGMSSEQFQAAREMYLKNRELILSAASLADSGLSELECYAGELQVQLENAGDELNRANEMLETGLAAMEEGRIALESVGAMLEQGGQALDEARAQLDAKLSGLSGQLEDIRAEKKRLSTDSREIDELEAQTEKRRELEGKRTSLSLKLREEERIKELYDEGRELYEAFEIYAAEKKAQIEKEYELRLISCMLMIAGSLFGILTIIPSFGKERKKLKRLILPALCILLSLAAELTACTGGLGHINSALTVLTLAIITAAAAFPDKKKKTTII